MSNKKPKEINSIFEEIIQEWIGQGRSEEQIYGVRNFFTGIGGIKLKTLLQEKKKEMKIEIQYWKDLWVEEKQLKKPKK